MTGSYISANQSRAINCKILEQRNMTTETEKTTTRAIEIIQAWAVLAIAAVQKDNEKLSWSVEQRQDEVGAAQAGAELAFAAILATQAGEAPQGVYLLSDKAGFDPIREHKAHKSVGRMCRRIKDAE
jgi:hypothetical protein